MTIYNVQTNDGGRYRCGDNSKLEQIDVTVRGMYNRSDKSINLDTN